MLVIVSKEASFKLDHSMFCVDGCYEDGYTYEKDVFFMEGIKQSDWCVVGQCSWLTEPTKPYTMYAIYQDWSAYPEWVSIMNESPYVCEVYDDCGCVTHTTVLPIHPSKEQVGNYFKEQGSNIVWTATDKRYDASSVVCPSINVEEDVYPNLVEEDLYEEVVNFVTKTEHNYPFESFDDIPF